jgi:hypothetical protein
MIPLVQRNKNPTMFSNEALCFINFYVSNKNFKVQLNHLLYFFTGHFSTS